MKIIIKFKNKLDTETLEYLINAIDAQCSEDEHGNSIGDYEIILEY